jgi:hypothetical protein
MGKRGSARFQDLQRLAEALPSKGSTTRRSTSESGRAACIGAEEDDALWLELPYDPFRQFRDLLWMDHSDSRAEP